MSIRDFCIRRPVFAVVINVVLLLGGLIAVDRLAIRYLPEFVIPVVSINTTYIGASADQIESQITTPLEEAVAAIGGVDTITSVSRAGVSSINIQFHGNVDPDQATDNVRAKVAQVQPDLPKDTDAPIVEHSSLDSQPILYLSFADSRRDALALTDYVKRNVKPVLSGIPGVASIDIIGARDYAVRVKLRALDLIANNLSVEQIISALEQQNALVPSGTLIIGERKASVEATTALSSVEELNGTILKHTDQGLQLKLADVADVVVAARNEDTSVFINGQPAVGLGIQRQSDANPVAISRQLRARLPDLQNTLPATMTMGIAYDSATYIEASLGEVIETVAITIGLVVVVVLLSLGTLRASLIALVTIPLSLAGGLGFLLLMDYSLNTFTLLAFVLVIGLVVDDAIVEIENVQRHIDDGLDSLSASFRGSREVGFAVIAMTLTLAAVFAPIGLLPGVAGALFREFAFTLAATVLISGYVATTLSPMMTAYLLRPAHGRGLQNAVAALFNTLAGGYRRLLALALNARWLVLLLAALIIGPCLYYMKDLPAEMAPAEDQGYFIVSFEGPSAASSDYMAERAQAVGRILQNQPDIALNLLVVGTPDPHSGIAFVILKPWQQRAASVVEVLQELQPQLESIPGLHTAAINPNPLGDSGGQQVQFVMRGDMSSAALHTQITPFMDAVRTYPGIRDVTLDLSLDEPIIRLQIDRQLAADLGIDAATIGRFLAALFGDAEINKMSWDGRLYSVILQLADEHISPHKLGSLYLISPQTGAHVPLQNIVEIQSFAGPGARRHVNRLTAATLSGTPAAGYTLGQVSRRLQQLAEQHLPASVLTGTAGATKQLQETSRSTAIVFILAVVFIYMVLAAQFESFRDPLIILFITPFAITGAGLGLWLSGASLSLYSGIGFITLIGLIAKHGILITEFTNKLRDAGMLLKEALLQASSQRLRPIIMTTAAMVMGAMPLLYATGAGAASRRQIGIVIVAGMLFGTLLSLFVIPVVYSLFTRKIRKPLPVVPDDRLIQG